jgi:hypothetical protein
MLFDLTWQQWAWFALLGVAVSVALATLFPLT